MLSYIYMVELFHLPPKNNVEFLGDVASFADVFPFEIKFRLEEAKERSSLLIFQMQLYKEITLDEVSDFIPWFLIDIFH